MTNRREFLMQAAGLAGAGRKPNIVFILADDLGYGHLGCYGQTRIRTPNLDRLAAEGMRMTQAYSGCTVCAPSRSSLMSGLHTGHTPIRGNEGGVPLLPEEHTVAELLQKAGYRTGLFGKWGLGDAHTTGVPNRKGFDEFFGYLHQLHAHFYYTHFLWKNGQKVFLANRHDWRREYTHDLIAREAMDFVRRHRAQPFFLYLPFTIPHAELLAPDDSMAEYDGKFPETPFTSAPRFHYAPNPKPKAAIAAMITRMDRSVGQLMALLGELGLEKDTVVLFASDNGPDAQNGNDPDFFQAAGPLRGYKTTMYEGGIRVPFLARWPGRIPAGTVNHYPCAFWDFLPTAAELAGVPAPKGLDGHSLLPVLTSPPTDRVRGDGLYWESVGRGDGLLQAARLGDWKAVVPEPGAPMELYHLKEDIGERRNLAQSNPEMARRMAGFLKSSHRPARPQTSYPPKDGRRYH
jgi:arylsulfatase A-like enzyme